MLELRRGRQNDGERAPAAPTLAMPHSAIDQLAGTGRCATGGTLGRWRGPRAPRRRVRAPRRRVRAPHGRVRAPHGNAPERALEVRGRALPRVVSLGVLATRAAKAHVRVGIASLLLEEALEALGHHLGSRAAEDEGLAQRPQNLGCRAY